MRCDVGIRNSSLSKRGHQSGFREHRIDKSGTEAVIISAVAVIGSGKNANSASAGATLQRFSKRLGKLKFTGMAIYAENNRQQVFIFQVTYRGL